LALNLLIYLLELWQASFFPMIELSALLRRLSNMIASIRLILQKFGGYRNHLVGLISIPES